MSNNMWITRNLLLSSVTLGAALVWGQSSTYTPGVTYQTGNPNYMTANPFYFEGRVDWNLLKITNPSNAWEYAQRGIMKQDDLEDFAGAIADFQQAYAMNNLGNGTCQLVTVNTITTPAPPPGGYTLNPAPCMFTFRLRLGYLLSSTNPQQAISLYQEVLQIDPMRLGVNQMIGDAYQIIANQASDSDSQTAALNSALSAYQAELALSPVTALYTQVTGDTANNAHTHWSLAAVYHVLGDPNEACELNSYLQATQWHSDTYVWRIQLAQNRLANLPACPSQQSMSRKAAATAKTKP